MGYRILADENVERATVTYLRKLGHDVECVRAIEELEFGVDDASISEYAKEQDQCILT